MSCDGPIWLFDGAFILCSRAVGLGRALPRPVRDWIYDRVARHRYRIFGHMASCMMPEPQTAKRLILPELSQ